MSHQNFCTFCLKNCKQLNILIRLGIVILMKIRIKLSVGQLYSFQQGNVISGSVTGNTANIPIGSTLSFNNNNQFSNNNGFSNSNSFSGSSSNSFSSNNNGGSTLDTYGTGFNSNSGSSSQGKLAYECKKLFY